MATTEYAANIADLVSAELVDCAPPVADEAPASPLAPVDAATPIQQAQDATIEQTGAGPPPDEAA